MSAPYLPVPDFVPVFFEASPNKNSEKNSNNATTTASSGQKNSTNNEDHFIHEKEIDYMLKYCKHRPIEQAADLKRMSFDYGAAEAKAMLDACEKAKITQQGLSGLLNHNGVASRWRQFVRWFTSSSYYSSFQEQQQQQEAEEEQEAHGKGEIHLSEKKVERMKNPSPRKVFTDFASFLGRQKTYRALALDENALKSILETADAIFPTGQLSHSCEDLQEIIEKHGVAKVLVARLFIANLKSMIGFDPSISLHDDWQTTTIISSGYFNSANKKVYLFEVSVPVVSYVGWRLIEVAHEAPNFLGEKYANHQPWFCFDSPAGATYFDATIQRTENYCLQANGVPFLKEITLRKIWKIDSIEMLKKAVAPFVQQQKELHDKFPEGEGEKPFPSFSF